MSKISKRVIFLFIGILSITIIKISARPVTLLDTPVQKPRVYKNNNQR